MRTMVHLKGIGRTAALAGILLSGPALVFAQVSGHDGHDKAAPAQAAGLRSRHITPGRSRRDTADLAPGDYVLFCGLRGHYAKGQRAALRVTP